MFRVFLHSLGCHLGWFFGSFTARGREMAPLKPRRWMLLFFVFPLFGLAQGLHWIGFLVDEILFRGYRRVPVERPLFVSGIPRSGTTFVHRILAKDTTRFTTVRTWEAVLAPSIAERRFWKAIGGVDRRLGGWGDRAISALIQRTLGDFAKIHAVGLDAPEEDYLFLLPAGACFIAVLAFPFSERLWGLARLDALPAKTRQAHLDFYRACLQKHLFVEGQGRRLLSKNAAFSSWLPGLRETFPEARFLVCVRDPRTALSSQLSSIRGGFEAAGGADWKTHLGPAFLHLTAHALSLLEKETAQGATDLAVVDQSALKEAPDIALGEALAALGETVSPALATSLAQAAERSRAFRSQHHHKDSINDLWSDETHTSLSNAYTAILAHRNHARQCPAGSFRPTEFS